MDLKMYQKLAHQTAKYTEENAIEYFRLNLLSEVGEAIGLYAKSIRDGVPVNYEKLHLELGDILWMCSEISTYFCKDLYSGTNFEPLPSEKTLLDSLEKSAHFIYRKLPLAHAVHRAVLVEVPRIVCIVSHLAFTYCSTVEEVAEANIAKLTSRALRNVIGGSGGDR